MALETEIARVNTLLDTLTAKRFACAPVAAQTIRAALLLAGLNLPVLEVETPYEGNAGGSVEDGKFILHGVETGTDPVMYAPPVEGEWFFRVEDSPGLVLYIAMDLDEQNLIECYAQILDEEEMSDVMNMDSVSDDDVDFPELTSDVSGEDDYLATQRHIGSFKGKE